MPHKTNASTNLNEGRFERMPPYPTPTPITIYIPVVPGQAGGGSFQKEKNYIAQKEFAYKMCARRPTSAMPKSFLCCERAFCCSMVVMFCALK